MRITDHRTSETLLCVWTRLVMTMVPWRLRAGGAASQAGLGDGGWHWFHGDAASLRAWQRWQQAPPETQIIVV